MTLGSPKFAPIPIPFPRSLSSIAVIIVGLAIFLIFSSLTSVSYPIGPVVRGYFYGSEKKSNFTISSFDQHPGDSPHLRNDTGVPRENSSSAAIRKGSTSAYDLMVKDHSSSETDDIRVSISSDDSSNFSRSKEVRAANDLKIPSTSNDQTANKDHLSSGTVTQVQISTDGSLDKRKKEGDDALYAFTNTTKTSTVESGCDLYQGTWFYDPLGPLYTNNTCPVLTQMQNCQGNGRPDKEYESWRWKPSQCDLPRFDAKKFLELMRGKTLAFIGDSVARNQMESMLCLLWQVEVPKNRGNRKMQRWLFRSTSVMIVRIWSSWLVRQTSGKLDFAPEGVVKLHLDMPDEKLMELIPQFDVVVISSGHWFAKQSVYVLNNKIVGGQLWWPNKARHMKINNVEAFGISVETILSAMVSHPGYKGLTILRSYSPDHYEGGAWNTGGSCTGKVKPLPLGVEMVENGFTNIMYMKQVAGFKRAISKATNKSKLRLMDITKIFEYRHDGHPGPYRNPDPHKVTTRGPDGRPPPQDCLHWCMPGPVDTWNELVPEVIKREFDENPERLFVRQT